MNPSFRQVRSGLFENMTFYYENSCRDNIDHFVHNRGILITYLRLRGIYFISLCRWKFVAEPYRHSKHSISNMGDNQSDLEYRCMILVVPSLPSLVPIYATTSNF